MPREPELVLLKKNGQRSHIPFGRKYFGKDFIIIAGPCSVENEAQFFEIARVLKAAGVDGLRGGAFKPRTSPYEFQGLGVEGLKILAAAREETGLPVVTEILDTRDIDLGLQYADMIQIGSRNMHNYALLKEAGKIRKPILLKRGMNATLMEWLNAAEYILAGGNSQVVLCERGIRTFELATRFSLDLNIVPAAKESTHLPIIVDPSHGTGKSSLVQAMSLASVAAGAHGVMIEVHPHPQKAMSDKDQQFPLGQFPLLVDKLRRLASVIDSFAIETSAPNRH